jgi:hypothetical protein
VGEQPEVFPYARAHGTPMAQQLIWNRKDFHPAISLDAEQRGRLSRGTEEGFARNTRPRTFKSELQSRFGRTSSQALIERARAALAPQPEPRPLGTDEDLLPLLEESLQLARMKK